MNGKRTVSFLLSSLLICTNSLPLNVDPTADLIRSVLDTISRGVKFFSSDYSSINVDGLFGLRLGQGQLLEAQKVCKKVSCGQELTSQLDELVEKLGDTCDKALPYVEETDEAYYNRFLQTISTPYILPYIPTQFGDVKNVKLGSLSNYEEDFGDGCYARIMGTYNENNESIPKCNITEKCWQYMTLDNTNKYFITHQLLYFIVIEHVGCTKEVENFINTQNADEGLIKGKKIHDVQAGFCRKVYKEAESFVEKGNVDILSRDLFLEQTVLCGSLGFEDFMRTDWVKMVLRWPDRHLGCFRMTMKQVTEFTEEIDKAYNVTLPPYEVEAYLETQLDNNSKKMKVGGDLGNDSTMRKLLREKAMKDGCLSHTSGLGFGVFGTYFQFLVRQMYEVQRM